MFRKRTVSRAATSSFSTTSFSSSVEENDSDTANRKGSSANTTERKKMVSRQSFLHRLGRKKSIKDISEEDRLVVTDSITLQEILLDEELHIEFELFLATQHAVENLSLWQELVAFASHVPESIKQSTTQLQSDMPARRASSRRASRRVKPTDDLESEEPETPRRASSTSTARRPSRPFSRRPSRRNTGGSTRRKSRMSRKPPSAWYPEAQRLFEVYMRPNAPQWVSLDDRTYRNVSTVLEERPYAVKPDFFNDIREMVFKNMQSDLVPRFIRSMLGRYPVLETTPSMMEL